MGLRANVFCRQQSSGPIAGIYTYMTEFDDVTIINADGPFDPSADAPAVILETEYNGPLTAGLVRARPVAEPPCGQAGWMFGGAFVHTCDSRFREAVEKLIGGRFSGAVALHDRSE